MKSMLEQLREVTAQVNELPPIPRCIIAHHSVPYGRAYRQWNTRGELVVWANRGQIADLMRPRAVNPVPFRFGIPVVNG